MKNVSAGAHTRGTADVVCDFGGLHAHYHDGFYLTLAAADDLESEQGIDWWESQALAEALERHDGLLLGAFDYEEDGDGAVTLIWTDYDMDDNPVGGALRLSADDVKPFGDWLRALPRPREHPQLVQCNADFERRQQALREELYAGLPDTVEHEGCRYRLWARDNDGNSLYGLPHAALSDPRRWILRTADGTVTASGRPQRPDRHGNARLWLHPRPPASSNWVWVREPPKSRPASAVS